MSKPTQVLPPIARIEGFLRAGPINVAEVGFVTSRAFWPATVSQHGEMAVEPGVRRALTTRNFGRELGWLQDQFSAVQDDLLQALRLTVPAIESLELELAAHGKGPISRRMSTFQSVSDASRWAVVPDGRTTAFSARSITSTANPNGSKAAICDSTPWRGSKKRGTRSLTICRHRTRPEIRLSLFPSWATHEVRNISCPSDTFADYRFAVNCWYCGQFKG